MDRKTTILIVIALVAFAISALRFLQVSWHPTSAVGDFVGGVGAGILIGLAVSWGLARLAR